MEWNGRLRCVEEMVEGEEEEEEEEEGGKQGNT